MTGKRWVLAVVVLTVVMIVWVVAIYNDPRSGGEYIGALAPIMLWIFGIAILVVARLMTWPKGPQMVCTNCGAELYGQWWSEAKGGFECRNCGQTTAGRAPEVQPGS